MNWEFVVLNMKKTLRANERMFGQSDPLFIGSVSTQEEIETTENELGFQIPSSMKEVFQSYSGKLEFRWFLPTNRTLPEKFKEIFCGGCFWSLEWLIQFNKEKDTWIQECFPDSQNEYDRVWHNKLAFMEVGNGDYLSVSLESPEYQPVVYLSHDDGAGHGYELGRNFQDFIERWSEIGCVGAEDWQWLPFTSGQKSYLESKSKTALEWKSFFGLERD